MRAPSSLSRYVVGTAFLALGACAVGAPEGDLVSSSAPLFKKPTPPGSQPSLCGATTASSAPAPVADASYWLELPATDASCPSMTFATATVGGPASTVTRAAGASYVQGGVRYCGYDAFDAALPEDLATGCALNAYPGSLGWFASATPIAAQCGPALAASTSAAGFDWYWVELPSTATCPTMTADGVTALAGQEDWSTLGGATTIWCAYQAPTTATMLPVDARTGCAIDRLPSEVKWQTWSYGYDPGGGGGTPCGPGCAHKSL